MKRIKISNGLVAIGASGKVGKTSFAIQLANSIAIKEKVLFLNWKDYADRLHQIIINKGSQISENLEINTNVGFFDVTSFIEIMELIEFHNYSTVFIDDINYFTQTGETYSELDQYNKYGKDSLIKSLRFIVDRYNVNIIFNLTIDTLETPKLADFAWSRLIINDCNQVIALSDTDDNLINVFELKNTNIEIKHYKIQLN